MSVSLLKDVAEVQTGYSFRTGVVPDEHGPTRVMQMRDLGEDGTVQLASLARVNLDVSESQHVRAGDILIRTRGDSMSSAIATEDVGASAVAAPLLRIRVTHAGLSAAYLNWYINQLPAQLYLAMNSEGSNVKMISKRTVEQLEVVVPSLQRQKNITELAALSNRERVLQHSLDERRDRLVTKTMMMYAEGGTR